MNPIVDPYAYGEFDPEGVPEISIPPVRSELMLDDICNAFKHKGWADHMIDDAHLLGTVRDALDLYCKMRATLVGMVELWKGLTANKEEGR